MKFQVKGQRGFTCVSNTFIDNYIKDANGEFVKIYLCLLRALDRGGRLSISDIADQLDHTQRDVARALKYWERRGLLSLEYDSRGELDGLCLIEPEPMPSKEITLSVESSKPELSDVRPVQRSSADVRPEPRRAAAVREKVPEDPEEVSGAGMSRQPLVSPSDEDAQELLFIAENYMARPLSATEINTILYWYTQMHMSTDLIDFLVAYCVDGGHKSIHYMNRVALNWAEQGINTVSKAKQETFGYNDLNRTVMDSFGISGRNLSKAEITFINRWSHTYSFSKDIIEEACRRTILTAHSPDFKYADSILKDWYLRGVSSFTDIEAADEDHSRTVKSRLSVLSSDGSRRSASHNTNRFHNFQDRDYDFAALEQSLLENQDGAIKRTV